MTPEDEATIDPWLVATAEYDERGFRRVDSDLTGECEARVLFVGDSFTDGLWVNDGETFVNRYGRLARDRGVRVCPVNAGVDGYGSMEEAYTVEHEFEAAGRPHIIFVMHFPNDVAADEGAIVTGTLTDASLSWDSSLSYLRRIAALSRARDVRVVLAAIPPSAQLSDPSTRRHYQDRLRRFAETEHITFVDLFDGIRDANRAGAVYWTWDPHFTPRGHQVILYEHTRGLLSSH
jgi:hypothetical protein